MGFRFTTGFKFRRKPATFYNWVKRLHKKACYEIPPAAGREDYKVLLHEQEGVVLLYKRLDADV